MPANDVSVRVGGEAGQGVESSGTGFAEALTRGGVHVFAEADYRSRIRGGHNFFTVRARSEPVYAVRDRVQVLIALTGETVGLHIDALEPGGAVIIDPQITFDEDVLRGREVRLLRPPLLAIAEEEGNRIMSNTGALAYVAGLIGLPLEHIVRVIEKNFAAKSQRVVDQNRRVAERSYEQVKQDVQDGFAWQLEPQDLPPRLTVTGNQSFAMGALMAGCKFVSGYPMTPSTTILEYMSLHGREWGIVARQAEDEIAAANMVIGAAHAGVRAMVPTSGGGFDLMTEAFSLVGMTETPVVAYLGQRPGPATGLPTRTCQGDLFLALRSSHGEFPRIVMAPHTPEEAFLCAGRAFNLAERYQTLAVVLFDEYLATSVRSADVEHYMLDLIPIDRGKLLGAEEADRLDGYKRFAITEDGISPRLLPGMGPKGAYPTTGDEHDEEGHITEDAGISAAMLDKRLRKEEVARGDMRAPYRYGPESADVTFVGWGSTYGAIREAVDLLNANGASANMVHFVDLWPFPREHAREALANARRLVDVEGNRRAQFAYLLHAETGIRVDHQILKYDGRGFTPDYILGRLEVE